MLRAALRPGVAQTCCRVWKSQPVAPQLYSYQRCLNSQSQKWGRKLKISDQLKVATEGIRKSAVRTGKQIRHSNFGSIVKVRFASITSRPSGVFRRTKNALLSQSKRTQKWGRKLRISERLKVATAGVRKSAAHAGRQIRRSQFGAAVKVRLASIISRPSGVFRRTKNALLSQRASACGAATRFLRRSRWRALSNAAKEKRERGIARFRKQVQVTRRGVRQRVQSAGKSVKSKTDGYVTTLRRQLKRFGLLGAGVYLTLGTLDWITFYYMLKWGVDVNTLMGMMGINKTFSADSAAFWPLVGAAYACHKALMPVRLVLTVLLTRPLWRYLVRVGWIKKPRATPKVHTTSRKS